MANARVPAGLAFAALLFVACRTSSANVNPAVGAAVMTAAGLSAAAANRASGGCVAICTAGTVCNTRTGLCDRQACDGKCAQGEICEETFAGSKCVQGTTGVAAKADGRPRTVPVVPITQAPDSNHASPTIVPAAEQRDPPK
jgi:hypothetical protein